MVLSCFYFTHQVSSICYSSYCSELVLLPIRPNFTLEETAGLQLLVDINTTRLPHTLCLPLHIPALYTLPSGVTGSVLLFVADMAWCHEMLSKILCGSSTTATWNPSQGHSFLAIILRCIVKLITANSMHYKFIDISNIATNICISHYSYCSWMVWDNFVFHYWSVLFSISVHVICHLHSYKFYILFKDPLFLPLAKILYLYTFVTILFK